MIDWVEQQTRRDLEYLAGSLPHRGAYTGHERTAAEYLQRRFSEHTPDTELDEFTSIESFTYLFASYYAEFLFVAIAAIWFPFLAFGYGLAVFVCYIAEFTGYRLLARLLPQYESQNVVARFLSPRPTRLFVVTAHYDSPRTGLLSMPGVRRQLRPFHLLLVFCMMAVLVSCLVQGFQVVSEGRLPVDLTVRWSAVAILVGAAGLLFYHESSGEYSSGAVDNASGTALLLALAGRLRHSPLLEDAEVWLVATGAKDAWMSGMHHFVRSQDLDKENTYFLHVDNVGAPVLRYETGEGLLHLFKAAPELVDATGRVAAEYGVGADVNRERPSDALVTLARGYKALRITGGEPDRGGEPVVDFGDDLARVNFPAITRATAFTEATLRELAAALARRESEHPAKSNC